MRGIAKGAEEASADAYCTPCDSDPCAIGSPADLAVQPRVGLLPKRELDILLIIVIILMLL
jgi:hypothetical protein